MTLRFLLALLALVCVACGSEPAAPRCELGRSAACTCSSGAAGAQECGPSGVWSPCVCTAPDAAPVDVAVAVDAPADTAPDVAQVDAGSDVAVAVDAPLEASTPDASPAGDADAAADAPPPIGDAPPALADRVERMQVWRSLNGGPLEYEPTGSCRRFDRTGMVSINTRVGSLSVSSTGERFGTTIQCPPSFDSAFAATRPVVWRDDAGVTRANTSVVGELDNAEHAPQRCRELDPPVTRFEVRAFGCPTI